MGDNTFAAVGIPFVFSTPGGDILHGFGGSTGAAGTFAGGTVAAAALGKGQSQNEGEKNGKFH